MIIRNSLIYKIDENSKIENKLKSMKIKKKVKKEKK